MRVTRGISLNTAFLAVEHVFCTISDVVERARSQTVILHSYTLIDSWHAMSNEFATHTQSQGTLVLPDGELKCHCTFFQDKCHGMNCMCHVWGWELSQPRRARSCAEIPPVRTVCEPQVCCSVGAISISNNWSIKFLAFSYSTLGLACLHVVM